MTKDERGDIIVGWLTKVAIVITLVGVAGFDAISVATTRVSATDDANQAAREGAQTWVDTHGNIQKSYDAAREYAEQHHATLEPKDFVVASDGTVTVTIEKTATTLVIRRNGKTKGWAHVVAHGSGRAL